MIYQLHFIVPYRNKRKNKFGFQLRLVNQRSYVFAASSESELNNWLEKLCMAVHSSKQFSEDRKSLPDPGRSCLRKFSFHKILEFLFRINQFRTCIEINQRSNLLRNFKITRIIFEPTINQICSWNGNVYKFSKKRKSESTF